MNETMFLFGMLAGISLGWVVAILMIRFACIETIKQVLTLPIVVQLWRKESSNNECLEGDEWKQGYFDEEEDESCGEE